MRVDRVSAPRAFVFRYFLYEEHVVVRAPVDAEVGRYASPPPRTFLLLLLLLLQLLRPPYSAHVVGHCGGTQGSCQGFAPGCGNRPIVANRWKLRAVRGLGVHSPRLYECVANLARPGLRSEDFSWFRPELRRGPLPDFLWVAWSSPTQLGSCSNGALAGICRAKEGSLSFLSLR